MPIGLAENNAVVAHDRSMGQKFEKEKQFPPRGWVRTGSASAMGSKNEPAECNFYSKARSVVIRMCNLRQFIGKYKAKHLLQNPLLFITLQP